MSEATTMIHLQEQPTLSLRGTVLIAELGPTNGARLRALQDFVVQEHIPVVGAPFVRYHTFGDRETDVEVGIPVAVEHAGTEEIQAGHLPGGPALITEHIGAHDQLGKVYARVHQAMLSEKRAPNGAAWEIYDWIDLVRHQGLSPMPPQSEWRTRLVQPLLP